MSTNGGAERGAETVETSLVEDLARLLHDLQVPLGDGILKGAEIPLIEIRRKLGLHGYCNELDHLDAISAVIRTE